MLKFIYIGFISVILASCSLTRHTDSGYAGGVNTYPGNSAVMPEINPSAYTGGTSESLIRKESNLSSKQEIKQYYHYKPLLKTDAQRIEFLNQPNLQARNQYANSILFPVEKRDFSEEELRLISKRDIATGMSRKAVEESWGSPIERLASGSSLSGNELWIYKKLVPTSNGYSTEYRHVHFEAGHVAGWETKK